MVIEIGGKQHVAVVGSKIKTNQTNLKEGEIIDSKDLLTNKTVGLKVISNLLDKKINGLKFRSKSRYTRRYGHRQPVSILEVVPAPAKSTAKKDEAK